MMLKKELQVAWHQAKYAHAHTLRECCLLKGTVIRIICYRYSIQPVCSCTAHYLHPPPAFSRFHPHRNTYFGPPSLSLCLRSARSCVCTLAPRVSSFRLTEICQTANAPPKLHSMLVRPVPVPVPVAQHNINSGPNTNFKSDENKHFVKRDESVEYTACWAKPCDGLSLPCHMKILSARAHIIRSTKSIHQICVRHLENVVISLKMAMENKIGQHYCISNANYSKLLNFGGRTSTITRQ